jgi:hypothetical protein
LKSSNYILFVTWITMEYIMFRSIKTLYAKFTAPTLYRLENRSFENFDVIFTNTFRPLIDEPWTKNPQDMSSWAPDTGATILDEPYSVTMTVRSIPTLAVTLELDDMNQRIIVHIKKLSPAQTDGPVTGVPGTPGPVTGVPGAPGPVTGVPGAPGPVTGVPGAPGPVTGVPGTPGPGSLRYKTTSEIIDTTIYKHYIIMSL